MFSKDENGQVQEITFKDEWQAERYRKRARRIQDVNDFFSAFKLQIVGELYNTLLSALIAPAGAEISLCQRLCTSARKSLCCEAEEDEEVMNMAPGLLSYFNLLFGTVRAVLNGFFIVWNALVFVPLHSAELYISMAIGACEFLLFAFPLITFCYNILDILRRLAVGDTTHFQTKNAAMSLKEMTSVSMMRYLPSAETTTRAAANTAEWKAKRIAAFEFDWEESTYRLRYLAAIRHMSLAILDFIGPILSLFALAFKTNRLVFLSSSFVSWGWFDYALFLAFVNQIAGIRDLSELQRHAMESFVFSGNNTFMSKEELQLVSSWYNIVLMMCVARIGKEKCEWTTLDFIVFWYDLSPRKLQFLFKHHAVEGSQFVHRKDELRPGLVFSLKRINSDENKPYDWRTVPPIERRTTREMFLDGGKAVL